MRSGYAARFVSFLLVACCAGSVPLLSGGGKAKTDKLTPAEAAARRRKAARESKRPFRHLAIISTRDKKKAEVTAKLDVNFALNDIDDVITAKGRLKQKVYTRTYNGGLVGGIIRVRPGDVLKVRLNNLIPKNTPDVPYKHNKPNGFNITNLHTHGLHVSPEGTSDNIFLEIGPEASKQFCFDIPDTHTAGTFWYHAHRHGSVALQLTSGMAGPLIVDGGIDTIPEIAEAMRCENHGLGKVIVFTQMSYTLNAKQIGEVTEDDVYGPASVRLAARQAGLDLPVTLLNGVNRPVIKMRPGEVQRWRCIHAGVQDTIPLAIVKEGAETECLTLYEIALDGLPRYRMKPQPSLRLYPGYRSDFLVQAPPKPGTYLLKQPSLPASQTLSGLPLPEDYLARIDVDDLPPVTMKLPAPEALCKFALTPVDADELVNRKPIPFVFKAVEAQSVFTVNGEEFEPGRIDACPRLGTAEEWILSSEADIHPFHIHVNPFEVVEKDEAGRIQDRYWRDTIIVFKTSDEHKPVTVRIRFETFPGKTVLHCHNLAHEDQGMMMAIRIAGKAPPSRCPPAKPGGLGALPAKAPDWELVDAARREHRLAGLAGRKVLLVFIQGLGCAHCRRQLGALARRQADLRAAGLTVVAVCPDSPGELSRAAREAPADVPPSFLLLSDTPLEAFRQYGCHDGQVLHGTFLIDGHGFARWQAVGDEPFLDVEAILRQARTLSRELPPAGG